MAVKAKQVKKARQASQARPKAKAVGKSKTAGQKTKSPRPKSGSKRAAAKQVPARDRRSHDHPESLRLRSASPGFTVGDLAKSLAFYTEVLGFTVAERWERDGVLMGAELVAGDIRFMLGQDDWKKGRDRKKGEGFRMYCTTAQDIDALASRVKARGGTLSQEPQNTPWGTRDFGVEDPDGFKLTISTEWRR